jgi:hypothetical protein
MKVRSNDKVVGRYEVVNKQRMIGLGNRVLS